MSRGFDYTPGCPMTVEIDGTCNGCGTSLIGRASRWCSRECANRHYENHMWSYARFRARQTAGGACARCGSTYRPEVNHKTPVMGKHDRAGCHHHQDGLEVLCHACHLAETKAQRDAGLLGTRAKVVTPSLFAGDYRSTQ